MANVKISIEGGQINCGEFKILNSKGKETKVDVNMHNTNIKSGGTFELASGNVGDGANIKVNMDETNITSGGDINLASGNLGDGTIIRETIRKSIISSEKGTVNIGGSNTIQEGEVNVELRDSTIIGKAGVIVGAKNKGKNATVSVGRNGTKIVSDKEVIIGGNSENTTYENKGNESGGIKEFFRKIFRSIFRTKKQDNTEQQEAKKNPRKDFEGYFSQGGNLKGKNLPPKTTSRDERNQEEKDKNAGAR